MECKRTESTLEYSKIIQQKVCLFAFLFMYMYICIFVYKIHIHMFMYDCDWTTGVHNHVVKESAKEKKRKRVTEKKKLTDQD